MAPLSNISNPSMPDSLAGTQEGLWSRIKRIDDGQILRVVFYAMLSAVVVALYMDYDALSLSAENSPADLQTDQPILPPFVPETTDGGEAKPNLRPEITAPQDLLKGPMRIELQSAGILRISGTIDVGSAARFSSEIAPISEYVKRIELLSPGGSVNDAIEIGEKIRELKLDTFVAKGALCASSCPLIFAAGIKRIAEAGAAIGVHQVYTGQNQSSVENRLSADIQISGTQTTLARINRFLESMGVDTALWLHALDTPPRQLYYFNDEELIRYKLATKISK